MVIGKKIVQLRKESGWSQQELAKKVGTSGAIVGRYERGEMTPSVEVAKKLADVFQVTLDYLVNQAETIAPIKDKAMLERLREIEQLDPEDKDTLLHVIDSLLRDARARKTYSKS